MEQLSRIEARLESLGELGDLVAALRSMAASRVREAQEAQGGTRAFRAVIDRAIGEISPLATLGRDDKPCWVSALQFHEILPRCAGSG